jgi:branched-chain amino acid transport system permease protein
VRYLQYFIDAVALGALYSLVALGIGLVFGVMRLVNLAYGELLLAGGYTLFATNGWPAIVRVVLVLLVMVGLALAMERLVFRRLNNASPASMLVVTFALSFLLRNIAQKKWSAQGKPMNIFGSLSRAFTIGDVRIKYVTLVSIAVGAALLAAVNVFLTKTDIGLQMRAVATDRRIAQALGVRVNTVVVVSFAISGVLAAAALLLFVPQRPTVTPDFGIQIVILALVGVVVGGMDRLAPATFGGFAIGFANSMVFSLLPTGQRVFLDSALYALVIVVLLVRPQGLFQRPLQTARV